MADHHPQYKALFDYLSAPTQPTERYPTIVFGRKDLLVAHAAGRVAAANLAQVIVISGGIGKDSGDIGTPGSPYTSEAHFLGIELENYAEQEKIPLPPVILEEKARHGGENAGFSLQILHDNSFAFSSLTTVAHATSLRRLAATTDFKAQTEHGVVPVIYRVPSAYEFNPANPVDQDEAVAEMRRLIGWPAQGLLLEQPDLPQDLVDFATSV